MTKSEVNGSWGLSLFVLFERYSFYSSRWASSWGLSLFVLFEQNFLQATSQSCSWGLSLFVLFEPEYELSCLIQVLED